MVVRTNCMYSDDFDVEYYEEGELSKGFDYELHDGQLCAIVDGEFVPCEDDIEFEFFLRRRDEEDM